ncbi:SDR family NAD(P)-dependent oxidoreductase, partial [Streptomyces sp. DT7]
AHPNPHPHHTDRASVAVHGRTAAKREATCAMLRGRGVRAEPLGLDVRATARIPAVVEDVAERRGRIDILVNNAYTGCYGPLLSLSDE